MVNNIYVLFFLYFLNSNADRQHAELTGKLEDYQTQINESKVDKNESLRFQRKEELLENLKRLFPGVYGRLIDLCEPVHKK